MPGAGTQGATGIRDQVDDTCYLNGTARMQRGQCRLPVTGHSQSMGLRQFGFSDSRRRQSVADHPGNRVPTADRIKAMAVRGEL